MSNAQLLSSKIVVQEEPPSLRTIQNVATGVLALPGVTAKGPVGVSTLVTSFEGFVRVFGGDIAAGFATSAVRAFFSGGGQRLYFTRVVHYTDITSAASKTSAAGTLTLRTNSGAPASGTVSGTIAAPYALAPGDTLVVGRDVAGSATATFAATRAAAVSDAEPFALVNAQTLLVKIDGGAVQTITFSTSAFVAIATATASEVAAVINAGIIGATARVVAGTVSLESDTFGTSSSVEVTGGTANGDFGFATSEQAGTGNVADIGAVSLAEIKTIVEAAVSGVVVDSVSGKIRIRSATTGGASSVQVLATSTADDELGLDNATHTGGSGAAADTLTVEAKYDGSYASNLTVLVKPSTSGSAEEFNVSVLNGGVVVETFPNVTMLNTATRFVETLVNDPNNGSNYIRVTDLNLSPSSALAERPANSSGSPAAAFGPLTGGADGLDDLEDVDFVGDGASKLGFRSFDLNADVDLLICPDRATPAVHNAGLSYASVNRNNEVFFIVDPPAGLSVAGILTYIEETAALMNLTEAGAAYWPRVKVLNPNASVYGSAETIIVPPSGHIAGMFARTDSARVGGVYDPPGGVERGLLPGVIGFENDAMLDENVRDLLAPKLINPITRLRGQPIAVDDVLTLKAGGAFPTIAERRGVSFIERSLKDGTQFARLRNNDESLRDEVDRTIESFLLIQMRNRAFRSQDPTKAFFVDVGEGINPPSEQFAGKLNVRIGLATQKPDRFLILSFSQDTRAIDEELAAASSG